MTAKLRRCAPLLLAVLGLPSDVRADDAVTFPRFKTQEIAKDFKIGYAVVVADINGDGKPDIVVVDKHRVIWYENPTWKVRTIIEGTTKPDNVCIAAVDIDGDGQLDLVLGADWAPFNTKSGGTLQWLRRGKTLDEPWTMYPIGEEPTVHRVRVADLDGDGKPWIVLVPLMGRESTQQANWADGRPVRILAYPIPKDPVKGPWEPKVISEDLHVVHNFWPIPQHRGPGRDILTASYEGVDILQHDKGPWTRTHLHDANQANPKGNRGASEIKLGHLSKDRRFIATVEPWHGNQIVVYTMPDGQDRWQRQVIDEQLRWGHGVWCADLDGDGRDELIIGVRDDPNPKQGDTFKERRGVRIYKSDAKGEKWVRHILEDGGVAVEDLTCADLNGDGKIDIIAVGRQTGNCRIYWGQ
jgi:hypothetical protein